MKEITLTQGMVAIVDDEDFDGLRVYRWRTFRSGRTIYACRDRLGERGKTIFMHRQILNVPPGVQVDHADGNGLNNRRLNIRSCSRFENMRNRRIPRTNKSGFYGVSWSRRRSKWTARIRVGEKHYALGQYDDRESAAQAYDRAARIHFREFGTYNFPRPGERSAITGEIVPLEPDHELSAATGLTRRPARAGAAG